jgi:hypothetical protein
MKCNEILSKWCENKHRASKIIDTFETCQTTSSVRARPCQHRRRGDRCRSVGHTCMDKTKMSSIVFLLSNRYGGLGWLAEPAWLCCDWLMLGQLAGSARSTVDSSFSLVLFLFSVFLHWFYFELQTVLQVLKSRNSYKTILGLYLSLLSCTNTILYLLVYIQNNMHIVRVSMEFLEWWI